MKNIILIYFGVIGASDGKEGGSDSKEASSDSENIRLSVPSPSEDALLF